MILPLNISGAVGSVGWRVGRDEAHDGCKDWGGLKVKVFLPSLL